MAIEWQEKVKKEEKNMRFCFNCGKMVKIRFTRRERLENTFVCVNCGDVILTTDDRR
jgi:predicted RNA-binding Zn-ribbon protein involved in translation (DUF1610 family)